MRLSACLTLLACSLLTLPAFAANYTYLALGDSIPFGFNPLLVGPYPQQPASADGYVGYPEVLAAVASLKEVNASCPGETSGSFLYGVAVPDYGCNSPHADPPAVPFREIGLHTNYTGTQMQFAISQLSSNKKINLVTLSIGANDVLLVLSKCAGNPDLTCIPNELKAVLPVTGQNLAAIIMGIRSQYQGTLIVSGYYSPAPELDTVTQALNGVIQQVIAQLGQQPNFAPVKYADAFTAFKTASSFAGGDACKAGLLIKYPGTQQCDIHPTKLGQAVIAGAVTLAR